MNNTLQLRNGIWLLTYYYDADEWWIEKVPEKEPPNKHNTTIIDSEISTDGLTKLFNCVGEALASIKQRHVTD